MNLLPYWVFPGDAAIWASPLAWRFSGDPRSSVRGTKGKSGTFFLFCYCYSMSLPKVSHTLFVLFDILFEATGQGLEGVQAKEVDSREGSRINQICPTLCFYSHCPFNLSSSFYSIFFFAANICLDFKAEPRGSWGLRALVLGIAR